ncbi:MAG: TonB-dependent receptor plug domain-containing protein, partial [Longimicrobiales bacterium]
MRSKMIARVHLFLLCLFLLPGAVRAQEDQPYRIQGTVVGANTLAPLIGVQVSLRGTNFGTLSDAEGNYAISALVTPGTYTLEFDYIGRRSTTLEIELGAEPGVTVPQVELGETAVELDQIVVTAPGVATERRAVPSAVATVSGEDINRAPGVATVDQALQGKITGALISETSGQPGGGVTIRLRGPSSILGTAEPLVVIDGVIADNDTQALIGLSANVSGAGRSGSSLTNRLGDIAPSDIERVEVLKGAAAAALYGSRAKNGVIQIFTRRGRQGPPTVTLTSDFAISRTPDKFDLLTAPLASRADVVYGFAPTYGAPVERLDYQDEIFRTGLGANTTFSIAGGSEGTSYFVSGNYQTEEGITVGSDYEKTSARAKVTQQLSQQLALTANGNFIHSRTSFVPEGEQTVGVLTSLVFTPTAWDPSFDENLGRYPYNPVLGPNPFDIIENWDANEQVTRFVGGVEGTFRPMENLSLRYLFGIDDYRLENKFFQPPQSIAGFTGLVQNPVRLSRQVNHDLIVTHNLLFGEGNGFT